MNKPKAIGTACESAVVKYLREAGWPFAERRALTGSGDQGDITGTPGLVWEIKGGKAAESAAEGLILAWLNETDRERENAKADYGVLITKRRGKGMNTADQWWAYLRLSDLLALHGGAYSAPSLEVSVVAVRLRLKDVVEILRAAGYGGAEPEALRLAS